MKKVTIVSLSYNHEKFIRQTLEGFVNQKTNFDFEVLVSDDCSTDDTPKIISEYAKKYPNIIKPLIRKKNLGVMKNFIDTFNRVKTKYVAYCEGDDYWCDKNKLQEQVDFLDKHSDYNICFHQNRLFFDDASRPDEIYPSADFPKTTNFENLLKENFIPANTVMYRWRFIKNEKVADIFPTDMVPCDYYMHLLHASTGKIYFINKIMSCYRRHSDGMWWLSTQADKKDDFSLKYGNLYINFFKAVEKNFKLEKNYFTYQKEYLANDLIRACLNGWFFDELIHFRESNRELFDKCITNFSYQQPIYNTLPKTKKLAYLLIFDSSKLIKKIKSKLMKIIKIKPRK